MSRIPIDKERERRIEDVFVDIYAEDEDTYCWYYYLDSRVTTPFQARWITPATKKQPEKSEIVEVVGMASEEECARAAFVRIAYREEDEEDIFTVPLRNIEPIDADEETKEAIADWHYWADRNYED